ncbi:MAG: uroporphyrinogen decarboxylase family protein [Anaerolineae bacterium]
MQPRDIILANINHENPPRAGMTFDRGRVNDMLGCGLHPHGYEQKRWTEGPREYYDDEWGNLWVRMRDGSFKGEIFKPAIEDWSQLDALQPPDYSHPDCAAFMTALFAEPTDTAGADVRFKIAHIGGWIFDNARYLRKMEVYFADMALYPDELKRMHQIVAGVYEQKIHLAGKAGADGIMIGEDMGTQTGLLFSPKMFREYFKAMYTRLMGIAHDYGMKVLMHSCGQNWVIVPDLLDAGVDVFQFDQPALYDMPKLAALLEERKAALWSPVDIQKILPTGDRATIEAGAREMYDIFEGGLICKNYPDLHGIGVEPEWDMWAYNVLCEEAGLPVSSTD